MPKFSQLEQALENHFNIRGLEAYIAGLEASYTHAIAQTNLGQTSNDQWFKAFQFIVTHEIWSKPGLDPYLSTHCLTRLLYLLTQFMKQLNIEEGVRWRDNQDFKTSIIQLLDKRLAYCSCGGLINVLAVARYMGFKEHPDYKSSIQPELVEVITNQLPRFSNHQVLLCIKHLAFLFLDQTISDNDKATQSLLKNLFFLAKQYVDPALKQADFEIGYESLGMLVQSFYALKQHPFFNATAKDRCISQAEKQLSKETNHVPDSENQYLSSLIASGDFLIDRQALCCGFSLDGLLKHDNQWVDIEIDGSVHEQYGKFLVEEDRDYLIRRNGLWVCRNQASGASFPEIIERFIKPYLEDIQAYHKAFDPADGFVTKLLEPITEPSSNDPLYSLVVSDDFNKQQPRLSTSQYSLLTQPASEFKWSEQPSSIFQNFDQLWQCLARQGLTINDSDKQGETALHQVVREGYTNIVKALIANQADVALTNQAGITPLTLAQKQWGYDSDIASLIREALNTQLARAIYQNDTTTMRRLITAGASIHAPLVAESDAFHLAVKCGRLDSLELLIQKYDRIEPSAELARKAVLSGGDIVGYLFEKDLLKAEHLNTADNTGYTALHYAIRQNDAKMINQLLISGAKFQSVYGLSVVELANYYQSADARSALIDYLNQQLAQSLQSNPEDSKQIIDTAYDCGFPLEESTIAYPLNKPIDWVTPLQFAILNDNYLAVNHLINHYKVALDSVSRTQNATALHHAIKVSLSNPAILDLLWSQKSVSDCINWPDSQGDTPLHIAIMYNHQAAKSLLERSDVDLAVQNQNGQNTLHISMVYGLGGRALQTLLTRLESDGHLIDMSEQYDSQGYLPVHIAAQYGRDRELVYLKLKNDATVYQPTSVDKAHPIHMAARYGHFNVIKRIINTLREQTAQNKLDYLAVKDANNKTPIQYALDAKQTDCINQLLDFMSELLANTSYISLVPRLINEQINYHLFSAIEQNEPFDVIMQFARFYVDNNSNIVTDALKERLLPPIIHAMVSYCSKDTVKLFLKNLLQIRDGDRSLHMRQA